MRKFVLFLSLCLTVCLGYGQSSPDVKQQIRAIRKAYQEAQQEAAVAKAQERYVDLHMRTNMPGSGLVFVHGEFYATAAGGKTERLRLVRSSWKVDQHAYYREFLFNPVSGALLFSFYKGLLCEESAEGYESVQIERRTYYAEDQPVWFSYKEIAAGGGESSSKEGADAPARFGAEDEAVAEAYLYTFLSTKAHTVNHE